MIRSRVHASPPHRSGTWCQLLLAGTWACALVGWATPAHAQGTTAPAPSSQPEQGAKGQGEWTALERSLIAEALEAKGLEIEPTPEGKAIEKIVVYVAPVFDHRDPIPKIFNIF